MISPPQISSLEALNGGFWLVFLLLTICHLLFMNCTIFSVLDLEQNDISDFSILFYFYNVFTMIWNCPEKLELKIYFLSLTADICLKLFRGYSPLVGCLTSLVQLLQLGLFSPSFPVGLSRVWCGFATHKKATWKSFQINFMCNKSVYQTKPMFHQLANNPLCEIKIHEMKKKVKLKLSIRWHSSYYKC